MSCSRRPCPPGQPSPEGPCALVRRVFVPCPLLRARAPANDNARPRRRDRLSQALARLGQAMSAVLGLVAAPRDC